MKIDDLKQCTENGMARVSAKVTWEECDRPSRRIEYATPVEWAGGLTCDPHAFLLAAALPAMVHGERRIRIEGKVCPQFRNGLTTSMQLLGGWWRLPCRRPEVEPSEGFEAPRPKPTERAAMLMSGGIDALWTLRHNRLNYPLDHPASIRDGFLVHGIDLGGYTDLDSNMENFDLSLAELSALGREADLTLVPVYTNLRHLDDNDDRFARIYFGASLSSVIHAFSGRVSAGRIAASHHVSQLMPWGSHPLLEPNYSNAAVALHHDGIGFSRMEKVARVAEWDVGIKYLRVCFHPFRPGNRLNCGQCEKCLRTMVELLVAGKLADCRTFAGREVTVELLNSLVADPRSVTSWNEAVRHIGMGAVPFWEEMIEPLRLRNRGDLAEAIRAKLHEVRQLNAQIEERDLRGTLKRLDRALLGGRISHARQWMRAGPTGFRRAVSPRRTQTVSHGGTKIQR